MPSSLYEGKDTIIEWVKNAESVSTILDIGCGEGTYPMLLNQFLPSSVVWWGVEAWKPYIEEFKLSEKYNYILNEDVRLLNWNKLPNFDLVFFGDILEHMTKEESLTVVSNAMNKSKFSIISIPIVRMKQGAVSGNHYEIHVKDDWSHDEVMSTFPNIKEFKKGKKIGVYLLEGSL